MFSTTLCCTIVFKVSSSPKGKILILILQLAAATSPTFLDGQRGDRNRVLNGSTRSLASNHPMLGAYGGHGGPGNGAPATNLTTTSAVAASAAAGGFGGHYNGQSPVGETLRHHLTSEGTSLSTKVHTVILSGNTKVYTY